MPIAHAVAAVLVLIAFGSSSNASAQELFSWTALPARTTEGNQLRITLLDGTIHTGRLVRVTGDAIEVSAQGGPVRLASSSVAEIRRRGDSIWDGAVLGAAVGAGLGLASGIAWQNLESKNKGGIGVSIGMGALYGFGLGIGIDALRKGTTAIYRLAAPVSR